MIQIEHRAPSEADISFMLRDTAKSLKGAVAFGLVVSGAVAALIYAVSKSVTAAVVVGCVIFIPSLISNLGFFKEVNRRKSMMTDPKAIEVIHVNASRIIQVQPIGSGEAHVFLSDSGEAVLLNGQWQLEYKPFPVADFKVHRWADTKEPIRIESSSKLVFPEESNVEIRRGYVMGDVELFRARPDTLQHDMDAAFGKSVDRAQVGA
jgi:nucleoid DNA-binding protein